MRDTSFIIIAFIVCMTLAACDILVKKPSAPIKKVHYELVMGNTAVSCKKAVGNDAGMRLSECAALINGIEVKIPDLRAATNVMEFEDKDEDQQ